MKGDETNSILVICERCVSCSPPLRELVKSGARLLIAHNLQDACRLLGSEQINCTVVHDDSIGSGSVICREVQSLFPNLLVNVERMECAAEMSAGYGIDAIGHAQTLDEAGHLMGMVFMYQQSKQSHLGYEPPDSEDQILPCGH